MSGSVAAVHRRGSTHGRALSRESAWARAALIALALGFLGVMLVAPLVTVFISAFAKGLLDW